MEKMNKMDIKNKIIVSQVMMPHQANLEGNVHGGEIMKLMDTAAAAAAQRYSKTNCVTARVDELEFHLPIFVGALVTYTAYVVYVGNTSMEVFVSVSVEDLESYRPPQHALSAYFTIVSMGKDGRPKPVKPYTPETEDEIRMYNEAMSRRALKNKNTNVE
ncbi:MAG: acyl-CoA thioesterase [Anaerovoracaceae bacterium]